MTWSFGMGYHQIWEKASSESVGTSQGLREQPRQRGAKWLAFRSPMASAPVLSTMRHSRWQEQILSLQFFRWRGMSMRNHAGKCYLPQVWLR